MSLVLKMLLSHFISELSITTNSFILEIIYLFNIIDIWVLIIY